jgi:hypothetical protein
MEGTVMAASKPLIMVDTWEVHPGRMGELLGAVSELASFVRMVEPRIIAYQAHLNEDGTHMTLVQIHPDSAAAEFHMEVAGSAFPGFARFITLTSLDIYGEPSDELLEQIRVKAEVLGADEGAVHVHMPEAGFARLPTGSLLRTPSSHRRSLTASMVAA